MLHVHRSERADDLVSMLAQLVEEPLDDPMTSEVVSVPTRGIERWLTQRLSMRLGAHEGRQDGVCANIEFPFPGTLVGRALSVATGADPKDDPWLPERAVWPLMGVVEEHFHEPWLAPLAQHITNSATVEGSKRFSSIRHVADLFDRYAVHRPDMLQRWAAGSPEPDEAAWQMELWRLLRERIGRPSPAEQLLHACARLRAEPELLNEPTRLSPFGLPTRLSLFGLTRLPASYLDVLEAVGAGRDVHLFLLHPSPSLWDRLAAQVGPSSHTVLRSEDPTASVPQNPLLASWGRDAREMQLVLGDVLEHADPPDDTPESWGPRTLLRLIQDDVRADRAPGGGAGAREGRPMLAAADDSIRIHSCHGRGRQVEVLRDAILHLLEDDPTLEARDIIVMCPDIENFAPLIQATFGGHGASDDPTDVLEIRLADRSLRQTNPVMAVLAEVLELATSRFTATEVLDLAGREPVRRRFHFADEDLFRLEEWVEKACVRWGFDAAHRSSFRLEDIGSNTWQFGLDRILLGVTMADERQRLFQDTLPLDDVDSADIELAGRMAEFLDRLRAAFVELTGTRPIDAWGATLAGISDALTSTTERDAWQRSQMKTLLDELVAEATTGDAVSPLALSCDDVRSMLTDRLKGKPTRANFCTGHLTVCTLVPMRSIPHRVVCLLGLDDGTFPRHIERDGDDLTARHPRVGDRDVRSEDRQLLLDALLAAQDHLVVTFSGRDERSNLPRPPAVPVGELLDVVDHTVQVPGGRARASILFSHPLQPFDRRNYESDVTMPAAPWSFDALHLAGARAALEPSHEAHAFLDRPLCEYEVDEIRLDQLARFLRHPVRAFLRERLTISLRDRTREFEDAIPVKLSALEQWQIADRLLAARLEGASPESCWAVEIARGELPPGQLADRVLHELTGPLDALVAGGQTGEPPTSVDVRVDLTGLPSLVGTVSGVRGSTVHSVTYSKLGPAARLIAWLRLLALTATWPDRPFDALTVGRSIGRGHTISTATIGPLGPDAQTRRDVAETHLRTIVDLFQRGMREPLPLYCKTSAAWASALRDGKDPTREAGGCWVSGHNGHNEDKNAEHVLVLGGELTFEAMLQRAGQPRADETGDDWLSSETSRFALYARRLWDGLLEYEEIAHQ